MAKTLKQHKYKSISTKKFTVVSLLIDKNTPAFKFQSLRKEDLYKKGRKGIHLNYIIFMGSLLFENAKKINIRTKLNYFNLRLDLVINKLSRNLLIAKNLKYKKN